MKSLRLFAAFVCLAAAASAAQVNTQAIQAALARKPKVVRASWWGFEPKDSTAALQAAIDSGADKVIVENMGKPWIVDKIRLAGDQEVFFEKGVVVLAKKGAFRGKGDCLFTAREKNNVALIGPGATLKMRKADYQSDAYSKSEWRHCLSILSCKNVRIVGLTLAESGGDGIYLGVCKRGVANTNVLIKDVVCDGNHRQGISVISAENLLIENTVMRNTSGTPPQAGIDFEPNNADEKIVNCVMRNCVSENNKGYAYVFALGALKGSSAPVSARLENCVSRGSNLISLAVSTSNGDARGPLKGQIEFVRCTFADRERPGVHIMNAPANGMRLRFVRCVIDDRNDKPELQAPICFSARQGSAWDLGGVEFVDCTVRERVARPLLSFRDYTSGLKVVDVTGRIAVERGGERRVVEISAARLDEWLPQRKLARIPWFDPSGVRFVPASPRFAPAKRFPLVRQRGKAEYLVYARKGDRVALRVRFLRVGHYSGRTMPVEVYAPDGRRIASLPAAFPKETRCAFTAPQTGAYRLFFNSLANCVCIDSPTHRLCLFADKRPFRFISTQTDLYFRVPAAAKQFGVVVLGDGRERVNAALLNPAGEKVWAKESIDIPEMFFVKNRAPGRGETWRLRLRKPSQGAFEDYYVQLRGIPALLALSPGALLEPASR